MTPRKPKPVSPDDETFRRALGDVTPLARRNKVELAKPRPKPRPQPRRIEEVALRDELSDHPGFALERQANEPLRYARPGVRVQALRQLRRGDVQDELDLHGLTVADARSLLVKFLQHCRTNGYTRVRVIHGKGLRSANREPVLKAKVAGWLAQRNDVLAFREASERDGGSGALVVLLKAG